MLPSNYGAGGAACRMSYEHQVATRSRQLERLSFQVCSLPVVAAEFVIWNTHWSEQHLLLLCHSQCACSCHTSIADVAVTTDVLGFGKHCST